MTMSTRRERIHASRIVQWLIASPPKLQENHCHPGFCKNSKSVPMDARGFRHELADAGIMPGYEFRGAPSAGVPGVCARISPVQRDFAGDRL